MESQTIHKKSMWRSSLERVARNLCEPPVRVEDMMNMSIRDLFNYVSEHKIEPPQFEQIDLLEQNNKSGYNSAVKMEIRIAATMKDLTDIFAKHPELHGDYKFNRDIGIRKKEIKPVNSLMR